MSWYIDVSLTEFHSDNVALSFKLAGVNSDKPTPVVHFGSDYPGQALFSLAESC